MNDIYQLLLAEDVIGDDEIDALFSQLQPIAPPSTLVEDILAAAARLPVPVQRPINKLWDDLGLVAYYAESSHF